MTRPNRYCRGDTSIAESYLESGANRVFFAYNFALTVGYAIGSAAKVVVACLCEAVLTEELAAIVAETQRFSRRVICTSFVFEHAMRAQA